MIVDRHGLSRIIAMMLGSFIGSCVGESWESGISNTALLSRTITAEQRQLGVIDSSYAVVFHEANSRSDDPPRESGAFAATLLQTYGATAMYASCSEYTYFRGGTWTHVPNLSDGTGTLTVTVSESVTVRYDCANAAQNTVGIPYNYAHSGATSYTRAARQGVGYQFYMMGGSVVPFPNGGETWEFMPLQL